jgi:hypothetical protein
MSDAESERQPSAFMAAYLKFEQEKRARIDAAAPATAPATRSRLAMLAERIVSKPLDAWDYLTGRWLLRTYAITAVLGFMALATVLSFVPEPTPDADSDKPKSNYVYSDPEPNLGPEDFMTYDEWRSTP